ncbi:hypothetical protein Hanom_Chr14g01256681 [Helianthus anomalus]
MHLPFLFSILDLAVFQPIHYIISVQNNDHIRPKNFLHKQRMTTCKKITFYTYD